MHLIESYALNSGAKIDKPYIYDKFFPLSIEDDFIVIQPSSELASKRYGYWNEVLDILIPKLKENNIKIVLVGPQKGMNINNPYCYTTCGQANPNQLSYIMGKSLLYIGPDSLASHIASSEDKKMVVMFSIATPSSCEPYWSDEDKVISLTPDMRGSKYSYSSSEALSKINTINPEKIAESALSLLGIEFEYDFETVHIGNLYHEPNLDHIPIGNKTITIPKVNIIPNVRMDLNFDEQALHAQLLTSAARVTTSKAIDNALFNVHKNGIERLIYIIDKDSSSDFVRTLHSHMIKYNLVSYLSEEEISPLKEQYMDYGVITHKKKLTKKDFKQINSIKLSDLYFKSRKSYSHDGKIYPSRPHIKEGEASKSIKPRVLPVIDHEDFWEDQEHFYFLKKKA
tara:strand:- start:1447 stop:2640 length:1194 start_codon:yes stop_codon:yes gene_type:complete